MNEKIASLTSSLQAEKQKGEAHALAQTAAVASSKDVEIAALSSSLQAERQRGEAQAAAWASALDAEKRHEATRATGHEDAIRSRMYEELE